MKKVIRADQLIDFIKKTDAAEKESWQEKEMREPMEFYLSRHIPNHSDYAKKYEDLVNQQKISDENQDSATLICPKCGAPLGNRITKKGVHAGKSFLGCSNFPKCWYTKH